MAAINRIIIRNKEAILWTLALLVLAILNPEAPHVSLCPLKTLGLDFCPGCGLGRSISFLFRGQWQDSFNAHPLGFFAAAVLGYRIITLIYKNFKLKLKI